MIAKLLRVSTLVFALLAVASIVLGVILSPSNVNEVFSYLLIAAFAAGAGISRRAYLATAAAKESRGVDAAHPSGK